MKHFAFDQISPDAGVTSHQMNCGGRCDRLAGIAKEPQELSATRPLQLSLQYRTHRIWSRGCGRFLIAVRGMSEVTSIPMALYTD